MDLRGSGEDCTLVKVVGTEVVCVGKDCTSEDPTLGVGDEGMTGDGTTSFEIVLRYVI